MVKAAFILIDFHTQRFKISVERPCYNAHIPFIRYLRSDYPNINTAFCRIAQDGEHFVVRNKIRGRDIDIILGIIYHIHIDKLAHILVIERGVTVGDNIAVVHNVFYSGAVHIILSFIT